MILAALAFANTVCAYYEIDTIWMSYVGGTSVLTLMFLYLSSYVFKFCEYHRMFLHYIVVCNVIDTIDVYYGLPRRRCRIFNATSISDVHNYGDSIDFILKENIVI